MKKLTLSIGLVAAMLSSKAQDTICTMIQPNRAIEFDYKTNQIVLTTPCSSDYYIYVRKNEVLALHLYDKVDATREIITTFPDNSQLNNVFESKSNLYYRPTGPCVVTIRPINYK